MPCLEFNFCQSWPYRPNFLLQCRRQRVRTAATVRGRHGAARNAAVNPEPPGGFPYVGLNVVILNGLTRWFRRWIQQQRATSASRIECNRSSGMKSRFDRGLSVMLFSVAALHAAGVFSPSFRWCWGRSRRAVKLSGVSHAVWSLILLTFGIWVLIEPQPNIGVRFFAWWGCSSFILIVTSYVRDSWMEERRQRQSDPLQRSTENDLTENSR